MSLFSVIEVNGHEYEVRCESSRSLSSTVRIKNGVVVMKLSRYLIGRQRDKTVEKFLLWADQRLAKVGRNDFVLPIYEDGGRVCTHNKIYELSVLFEDRASAKTILRDGHFIDIVLPRSLEESGHQEKVKFWAEKMIIKDQTSYLEEVLSELNQLYFQQKYHSCRFKRTNGRFGSCSSKGNINISYRLLFAPREVFRYVCVHELAHLKEFNHSKRFWALVSEAMPDYKDHERWLRQSGFMLG